MAWSFLNRFCAHSAPWALAVLLGVVSFCTGACAHDQSRPTIVLNTGPDGFAPYVYLDSDQTPKGILYDVAHRILKERGYNLTTAAAPRKRVESQLKSGLMDATARALEWSEHASDFVFTDPIVPVRSTIIVRADSAYTTVQQLYGQRIAMRLGYVYTVLVPEFKSGQLIRTDTNSDLSILKLVQLKRVEAGLIDEAVARWVMRRHGIGDLQFLQESVDDHVQLRLMFAPRHRALVKEFNRELANLKRNGELAKIITSYTGQ